MGRLHRMMICRDPYSFFIKVVSQASTSHVLAWTNFGLPQAKIRKYRKVQVQVQVQVHFIHTYSTTIQQQKKVCSSQRSQAFMLAATTERLQVGGGYVVLIETSY